MTEPKKNKDGLVPGLLVSPEDYKKVMNQKRQKAQTKK